MRVVETMASTEEDVAEATRGATPDENAISGGVVVGGKIVHGSVIEANVENGGAVLGDHTGNACGIVGVNGGNAFVEAGEAGLNSVEEFCRENGSQVVKEEVSMTVEELVAKARAPVKKEFLTPAGVRILAPNGKVTGEGWSEKKEPSVLEEKSKRQKKKDRLQAKKSTENICTVVARTGDASKCIYGASCRFNHDLEGFIAQKPADLPGNCPSLECGEPCPYGISCRFAGTHKESAEFKFKKSNIAPNEKNALDKELQKLLWKNLATYPKADAELGAMGLLGKSFKMRKVVEEKQSVPDSANVTKEGPEHPTTMSKLVNQDDSVLPGHPKSCVPPNKKAKMEVDAPNENASPPGDEIRSEDCSSDQLHQGKDDNESKAIKTDWRSLYLESKLAPRERKIIDFREKLYLAPLTTVGNLPFRRVCKGLGADITCGEMAMCTNLLQGQASEWALLRRHTSEDVFGVQICGAFPDHVARAAELIERECDVDFIDINMGCPIDLVVNKGAGSCLLTKPTRLEQVLRATAGVMEKPLTIKVRMGYYEGRNCAHTLMPNLYDWGVSAVTVHGRTRQQRYSKSADWNYVYQCASAAQGGLQVIGNGDIMAYTNWNEHLHTSGSKLSTCLIARGALIKPWLFTEIKENRHWDISASERLDILKQYVHASLAHWGSDAKGVETTRHFLLEWLSYMHRYIPVGLLEVIPQRLNWRPPNYFGRNDLETMMASESAVDWVHISEMLLGPAPPNFVFKPKHKSNAYDRAENG